MRKLIIAVDGTAGSGKTETMQQVAQKINYHFIDTGLMYRAFTLLGLKRKINFNNRQEIIALIPDFNYEIRNNLVFLNGENVNDQLQTSDVLKEINKVTVIGEIRAMMVVKQRQISNVPGTIAIGRDITSVVLTNADLKIYLDCSSQIRAVRRYVQNLKNNILDMSVEQIEKMIIERDFNDKNRQDGPLTIVKDAWVIDNSNLTLDQTVDLIVERIKQIERGQHG
ncbi:(d)CMP kinase [Williamsoniiplasma lucivorax]|uniref:Cytidylate kinase n=1 Tax=Williamsoniiplasma lucivorax TaxID=209274 RepID=A0A2S5RD71_9MOLU|nr:(d)CMP kinase [Williamsoniiplasma lucivorax]PPE05263.1 cytidylate kinase [Williamsoniiplasma lucivorax]